MTLSGTNSERDWCCRQQRGGRRGEPCAGEAGPPEWQAEAPAEAPRAVSVAPGGDSAGHAHPWQVLRHTAQRDGVPPLLPQQGREYIRHRHFQIINCQFIEASPMAHER